jgi:hypothetical protein
MSEAEAPADLLAEMATLRRRARADRHGYWFPLLLFGALTVAAAPFYVLPEAQPGESLGGVGSSNDLYVLATVGDGGRAGRYWSAALIVGGLLTVWWYWRRGRRIGPPGAGTVAVTAAAAAVVAVAVIGFTPLRWVIWPLGHGYSYSLVIAAGLLGLAWVERSSALTGVAAAYTAAAVLANTYNVENVLFDLGWDPFIAHPDQARFTQLPNLLLPGLILLLSGAAAGLTVLVRRRRSSQ